MDQGKELGPLVQRIQDADVQRALLLFERGRMAAIGLSYKHRTYTRCSLS